MWFSFSIWVLCSLCNTKATSEQTLLLHAEGKKHKAKARAFHASKQQPQQKQESTSPAALPPEDASKSSIGDSEHVGEPKMKDISTSDDAHDNSEVDKGNLQSSKKRKHDGSDKIDHKKKTMPDNLNEVGDGEVIQAKKKEVKKDKSVATARENPEDACHPNEDGKKKIKWKKLIKSTLKSVSVFVSSVFYLLMFQHVVNYSMFVHSYGVKCVDEFSLVAFLPNSKLPLLELFIPLYL